MDLIVIFLEVASKVFLPKGRISNKNLRNKINLIKDYKIETYLKILKHKHLECKRKISLISKKICILMMIYLEKWIMNLMMIVLLIFQIQKMTQKNKNLKNNLFDILNKNGIKENKKIKL